MTAIIPCTSEYDDYLRDESRLIGSAEAIVFPTSEQEVIEAVKYAREHNMSITTQGARTGIVAGAVPNGGLVINLSRMKSICGIHLDEKTGEGSIVVQPGTLLAEVRDVAAKQNLFFPPDPTETSASIGGMVASNASGALTFHYGPTRNWVESLRIVLADGDTISLLRGECIARGRSFSITTTSGRVISGDLPDYTQPDVKSAAGYYVSDDMDLIDLMIGMEGTLGIITEIWLKLIPAPRAINALTVFLPSEEAALKSVRILRGESVDNFDPISFKPVGIEYFNSDALNLLRRMKGENSAFEKIPALKPGFHTAVYAEFHGSSDEELEEAVMAAMEPLAELGASDEDAWFATTLRELEPIKAFRHAVPEAVNLLIDKRKHRCPDITKLGTDMSVPDEYLEDVIAMYNHDLKKSGLESVIFGHIGNNHVHVNILPRDMDDYSCGKSLYMDWAKRVVELGGSVSAEHGIGKIKAPFLRMMYGDEGISQMRSLRSLFDPELMLNRGNLF
ncbi:FAD-binding oxidoreductase [bacterium]|nr:FAD-binding oxidoreductase [bacterium]